MSWLFSTATELLDRVSETGLALPDYLVAREAFYSSSTAEAVRAEVARRIRITRQSLDSGLAKPQRSFSGLTDGAAARLVAANGSAGGDADTRAVVDPLFRLALTYALAVNEVNACGGKIVAFPTAGSSGVVPGVLWAYRDSRRPDLDADSRLFQDAYLVASAVGMVIATRATIAGASGGCQAECGTAAAMASAGLLWLLGKGSEDCLEGAALSLKNCLGLACDPVAGLVEVPCVKRNAFMAANSLTAVTLVEAGVRSAIPFDEVVGAMKAIGDSMPAVLRESAGGGLALTPTGLAYKERLGAASDRASKKALEPSGRNEPPRPSELPE
jgi:L-serine dehydratase